MAPSWVLISHPPVIPLDARPRGPSLGENQEMARREHSGVFGICFYKVILLTESEYWSSRGIVIYILVCI